MKFMLKGAWLVLGGIAFVSVVVPATTMAHELAKNNGISAVMHIDPTDQPVAGVPVNVTFTFTRLSPGFSAAQCGCLVQISQGDKQVGGTVPAVPADGSAQTLSSTVTFPEQGSYTVSLYGLTRPGQNSTFHLSYAANVVPERHGISQRAALVIDGAAFMVSVTVAAGLAAYYASARRAADHTGQSRLKA